MKERYAVVSPLGSGAYGSVYKCLDRDTGALVALKVINLAHQEPMVMRLAMRELRTLQRLPPHAHVVELKDAFKSSGSGRVFLVFSCEGRSLHDEAENYPNYVLPGPMLKLVAWQMLQALAHLHDQKVIHRDVKPGNILLASNGAGACMDVGRNGADVHVRLADFGFARPWAAGEALSSYVATRWFRAPEILVRSKYSYNSDCWSVGCTIGELAAGAPLFPGTSTLDQLARIMRATGPLPPSLAEAMRLDKGLAPLMSQQRVPPRKTLRERLPGLDARLFEFVSACLQVDPKQRPSVKELMQMPYFWDVVPRTRVLPRASPDAVAAATAAALAAVAAAAAKVADLAGSATAAPSQAQRQPQPLDKQRPAAAADAGPIASAAAAAARPSSNANVLIGRGSGTGAAADAVASAAETAPGKGVRPDAGASDAAAADTDTVSASVAGTLSRQGTQGGTSAPKTPVAFEGQLSSTYTQRPSSGGGQISRPSNDASVDGGALTVVSVTAAAAASGAAAAAVVTIPGATGKGAPSRLRRRSSQAGVEGSSGERAAGSTFTSAVVTDGMSESMPSGFLPPPPRMLRQPEASPATSAAAADAALPTVHAATEERRGGQEAKAPRVVCVRAWATNADTEGRSTEATVDGAAASPFTQAGEATGAAGASAQAGDAAVLNDTTWRLLQQQRDVQQQPKEGEPPHRSDGSCGGTAVSVSVEKVSTPGGSLTSAARSRLAAGPELPASIPINACYASPPPLSRTSGLISAAVRPTLASLANLPSASAYDFASPPSSRSNLRMLPCVMTPIGAPPVLDTDAAARTRLPHCRGPPPLFPLSRSTTDDASAGGEAHYSNRSRSSAISGPVPDGFLLHDGSSKAASAAGNVLSPAPTWLSRWRKAGRPSLEIQRSAGQVAGIEDVVGGGGGGHVNVRAATSASMRRSWRVLPQRTSSSALAEDGEGARQPLSMSGNVGGGTSQAPPPYFSSNGKLHTRSTASYVRRVSRLVLQGSQPQHIGTTDGIVAGAIASSPLASAIVGQRLGLKRVNTGGASVGPQQHHVHHLQGLLFGRPSVASGGNRRAASAVLLEASMDAPGTALCSFDQTTPAPLLPATAWHHHQQQALQQPRLPPPRSRSQLFPNGGAACNPIGEHGNSDVASYSAGGRQRSVAALSRTGTGFGADEYAGGLYFDSAADAMGGGCVASGTPGAAAAATSGSTRYLDSAVLGTGGLYETAQSVGVSPTPGIARFPSSVFDAAGVGACSSAGAVMRHAITEDEDELNLAAGPAVMLRAGSRRHCSNGAHDMDDMTVSQLGPTEVGALRGFSSGGSGGCREGKERSGERVRGDGGAGDASAGCRGRGGLRALLSRMFGCGQFQGQSD